MYCLSDSRRRTRYRCKLGSRARSGQWQYEVHLRCASTVRWFECRGRVHRQSANALCADSYRIDVTERKAAELERAVVYPRFGRAFEAAPEPMGIVDEPGNLTALDAAFIRTFGCSLQEVPTLDSSTVSIVRVGQGCGNQSSSALHTMGIRSHRGRRSRTGPRRHRATRWCGAAEVFFRLTICRCHASNSP